jgi:thymidylate synthase (FAD)
MCQVEVDVLDPRGLARDFSEEPAGGHAGSAYFGRKLEKGCTLGKRHFGELNRFAVQFTNPAGAGTPDQPEGSGERHEPDEDADDCHRVHDSDNKRAVRRRTECEDILRAPARRVGSGLSALAARVSIVPDESSAKAVQFRSDVTVELVRSSASDSDVLFAARVSTQGEQTLEAAQDENLDTSRSKGLINYLMRDRHGSPFEHNSMTFYVQAPIFVFREFMRHRMASYNEESGRYRELNPVFYVPGPDRNLVQVGKAGAYDFLPGTPEQTALVTAEVEAVCTEAFASYQRMLDAGVAREVARVVLPLTIYSSMYVTMNSRALMNFLSLRTKREGTHFPSFPQREIEMVAEKMEDFWNDLMPLTAAAFNANGRVAP